MSDVELEVEVIQLRERVEALECLVKQLEEMISNYRTQGEWFPA